MQTARLFIGTGKQTRIGLLSAPVFKTRAPISNVLNGQIRSLHQHIQKESSTSSSPLTPHPPPPFPTTTPRLPQKLPSHTISTQLHSIASEILLSPQTQNPIIHSSYEKATGTWQYLVADPSTLQAVIIDSVLDYNPTTQVISTQTADSLFSLISSHKYKITKILETHAHADHLSAASYLQHRIAQSQGLRPPICIGKRITQVQEMFGKKYGISAEEYRNAFDRLFDDDEVFEVGELKVKVMHLPGHTPDHIGYIIGDNVFCGDSLFHADIGTARCDFPGGDANSLYESGRKLLRLPDHVKIWTGHDYVSEQRDRPVPWLSVREHKKRNKHLSADVTQQEFVTKRQERDRSLAEPKLLNASLQINIRGGRLPSPTRLGQQLLHLPLRVEGSGWLG